MKSQLKEITCDPICGFMVRSHDEDEVVNLAFMHVTKSHPDLKATRQDLKKDMKSV